MKKKRYFNTSHVTVYRQIFQPFKEAWERFQYISCYCLSLLLEIQAGTGMYFNTSHVTVYLFNNIIHTLVFVISIHLMLLFINAVPPACASIPTFQYISCYCLSTLTLNAGKSAQISIHLMLLFISMQVCYPYTGIEFQYISCYCLSW